MCIYSYHAEIFPQVTYEAYP